MLNAICGRSSATRAHVEGGAVWELIDYQKTVEHMLTDGRPLAEVEEYVERCALDEMEKPRTRRLGATDCTSGSCIGQPA
jgi:hypothetical protein